MGKITGLLMFILAIASIWLFVGQNRWWFPEGISEYAPMIDKQFMWTLGVVAIAFTAAQFALGYAVMRFGRKGDARAAYTHGSNKLEVTWTIITAAVFITLAILGQRLVRTSQQIFVEALVQRLDSQVRDLRAGDHLLGVAHPDGRIAVVERVAIGQRRYGRGDEQHRAETKQQLCSESEPK